MGHFVHALFPDQQNATKAVNALVNSNFPPAEIGALVANERLQVAELVIARKTIVIAGLVVGMIVGAAGGALVLASVVGLIALSTPSGALTGVALGALFGIFAGGLGGLGYWHYAIDFPRGSFRRGAILVGVSTHRERIEEARRVLGDAGARRTHVSSKNHAAQRALSWARSNVFPNAVSSPSPHWH